MGDSSNYPLPQRQPRRNRKLRITNGTRPRMENLTPVEPKPWHELSSEQRAAMLEAGHDEVSWNNQISERVPNGIWVPGMWTKPITPLPKMGKTLKFDDNRWADGLGTSQ